MNKYLYPEQEQVTISAGEYTLPEYPGPGLTSLTPHPFVARPVMSVEKKNVKESYDEKGTNSVSANSVMKSTHDPSVWGPPFWFTLHTSAVYYPVEASPIVQERMKNRILAIPYEIPCDNCRVHASAFIEKHKEHLDHITSGKEALGKFYVDFHNQVNKRYNKPQWTYEQALERYSGDVEMQKQKNGNFRVCI